MPIIQRKRQTKSLFSAHIIYKVKNPYQSHYPLQPAQHIAPHAP